MTKKTKENLIEHQSQEKTDQTSNALTKDPLEVDHVRIAEIVERIRKSGDSLQKVFKGNENITIVKDF